MIKTIINKGYLGYSVIHNFRRFEFQVRGTLHCHILIWLEKRENPEIPVDYNVLLQSIHGHSPDFIEDPFLYYLVKNYQTHTHTLLAILNSTTSTVPLVFRRLARLGSATSLPLIVTKGILE